MLGEMRDDRKQYLVINWDKQEDCIKNIEGNIVRPHTVVQPTVVKQ